MAEEIDNKKGNGLSDKAKAKIKKGLIVSGIIAAAILVVYFAGMLIYRSVFQSKYASNILNESGATVVERFREPEGFTRAAVDANSSAAGFRNFPLKTIGLAVYSYEGVRDFDADLGGVLDRDKEDIDQIFTMEVLNGLTETTLAALKPGDVVKAASGGEIRTYAVMDVCRNTEGKTLALLAELRDGYEKYVVKGEDGTFGGYWIDLAAGFTANGYSAAAGELTFLSTGN